MTVVLQNKWYRYLNPSLNLAKLCDTKRFWWNVVTKIYMFQYE